MKCQFPVYHPIVLTETVSAISDSFRR